MKCKTAIKVENSSSKNIFKKSAYQPTFSLPHKSIRLLSTYKKQSFYPHIRQFARPYCILHKTRIEVNRLPFWGTKATIRPSLKNVYVSLPIFTRFFVQPIIYRRILNNYF